MSWQKNLRKVKPYLAGEQPQLEKLLKLNTNENPYPPAPGVAERLKSFSVDQLNLYPKADSNELRKSLAKYFALEETQIFLGNGSDEVLALCFLAFFNSKKPILFPDISYSFYPVWCEMFGIKYETQALDDNFRLIQSNYFQPNGGIIFPNPNAPTGILVSLDFIEQILIQNQESVVVIDEAYIDFGGETAISLLQKYDNLVIVQTFSKSRALAGLRIGLALGNAEAIAHLYDVKNSFNSYPVDRIAQALALASVQDENYFRMTCQKIIDTREKFVFELRELGFKVLESSANFVFARPPKLDADALFKALKSDGIVVRHWNKPRIDQYLRITIGTVEDMARIINFLKDYYDGRL